VELIADYELVSWLGMHGVYPRALYSTLRHDVLAQGQIYICQLTDLLTAKKSVLLQKPMFPQSRNTSHIMELEGSLRVERKMSAA